MAKAFCKTCKQSAEATTYESAADSIPHGIGSKQCPGGPRAVVVYIDSKGNISSTIPKSITQTKEKIEFTADKKDKVTFTSKKKPSKKKRS